MKRKGARSIKEIPPAVLQQLNSGQEETANLVEWLAVNQQVLLENLLWQQERMQYLKPVKEKIGELKKQTVNTINEAIGTALYELTAANNDTALPAVMSRHTADLVRCWATYFIGKNRQLSIVETLAQIRPFAADKHFGVREICWMAVRAKIAENIVESIGVLVEWTSDPDEHVRRFATESTRPRGVWSKHIEILKEQPALALPILEALKADKAKYVQDSVGNWLNDAAKSQPEFVQACCNRWAIESNTRETHYIIKKALRTLNKS